MPEQESPITQTDGPKRIRAINRGLEVIEHLSNFGLSTLAELRHKTGLSNATLIRILATLQDRGWVRRNIVEGQYELTHSLESILGANVRAHPLAEIAAPILLNMGSLARGFPSDLTAIIGTGTLEIVESTRTRGPMAPARTGLGLRPSMVRSAHGQAVLAAMSREDRDLHVGAAKKTESRDAHKWFEGAAMNTALELTKARGYGLRDVDYFIYKSFDPGPDLAALAVPIVSKTGVHGALSVLWMREEHAIEDILSQGTLRDMQSAAHLIGAAMDTQKIPAFEHA